MTQNLFDTAICAAASERSGMRSIHRRTFGKGAP